MTCELSSIFDVRYGHSLELNALEIASENNGIAFVSRQTGKNGISAYVKPIDDEVPALAGEVTCALSGNGVLTTSLQARQFYTGYHVAILKPRVELTRQQILYYCACIKANRYRYSYGRQANKTLKSLAVPKVTEIPSWVNKFDLQEIEAANRSKSQKNIPTVQTSLWRGFKLSSLFDIKKGKRLTQADMSIGATPFVGAIDHDNGISHLVGQDAIFEGNTITINYDGNGVAEAYYQPNPYWALDSVNVLYPRFAMTPYVALFLCTLIRQEKFRYNYGRKWHLGRMKESLIRLPVTSSGDPDWQFMEDYIKSLPFSKSI